jgi:hypothetical protein
MTEERDLGSQPLVLLLESWGLSNHDLVAALARTIDAQAGAAGLSGQEVDSQDEAEACADAKLCGLGKARPMTSARNSPNTFPKHLFNYSKGYEKGVSDINAGSSTQYWRAKTTS